MDDELVAAAPQGETAPATTATLKLEVLSAPGLSSSTTCPAETPSPIIPLLPDLPFQGTPSMGHPFYESLAGSLQKKWGHSPSGSFSDHHGMRAWVNSPEVEA